MTHIELLNRIEQLRGRATQLCGRSSDGRSISTYLTEFYDGMIKELKDPQLLADGDKRRAEMMRQAKLNPQIAAQYCSIRVRTINNYLLPSMKIIPFFFNLADLKNDERPVLQNETRQEIHCGVVGLGGGAERIDVDKDQLETLIPMDWLSSDEVVYPLVDIYSGKIADIAQKTFDAVFDLRNQEETRAWKLLTAPVAQGGAFGTFDFTNPRKITYVYVPHSRVKKVNLPTTNDISLASNTDTSLFRFEIFAAGIQYVSQFADAFPQKEFNLTGRVKIPGKDVSNLAQEIVPSGSTRNAVADKLMEQGWAEVNYLGYRFRLESDNTINPGAAYFEMSLKVGDIYHKPGLDLEIVNNSVEYTTKNQEGRTIKKAFGGSINSAERIHALRVQYNKKFDPANP